MGSWDRECTGSLSAVSGVYCELSALSRWNKLDIIPIRFKHSHTSARTRAIVVVRVPCYRSFQDSRIPLGQHVPQQYQQPDDAHPLPTLHAVPDKRLRLADSDEPLLRDGQVTAVVPGDDDRVHVP